MKEISDIAEGDWVDRNFPVYVRHYLRIARVDRPVGIWLLAIPCFWGMSLGCREFDTIPFKSTIILSIVFLFGSAFMRAAGCTWNDILDRHIDAKVSRTAARPLASGQMSVKNALSFMIILLLASASFLLMLNDFAKILSISSLTLVAVYPLMKRITFWPQAFLGITFNWGVLVGFSAITGTLTPAALILYLAAVFWTLGYDTIYAHQDKEDDVLIGVKSTALKFGSASKIWVGVFYVLAITCFVLAGLLADLRPQYFIILIGAAGLLAAQVFSVNLDDPKNCLLYFKSNIKVGCFVIAAIIFGLPT